jgi:hypothetical protein
MNQRIGVNIKSFNGKLSLESHLYTHGKIITWLLSVGGTIIGICQYSYLKNPIPCKHSEPYFIVKMWNFSVEGPGVVLLLGK